MRVYQKWHTLTANQKPRLSVFLGQGAGLLVSAYAMQEVVVSVAATEVSTVMRSWRRCRRISRFIRHYALGSVCWKLTRGEAGESS